MANFENQPARFGASVGGAVSAIDEGLRAHMLRVYNYMTVGLLLTGLLAYGTYSLATTSDPALAVATMGNGVMLTSLGATIYGGIMMWVLILAPLALVFFFSFKIQSMRPATAQITFWVFAALIGLSLSSIFLVYTHTSIVRVFFITAASFGALSLYGYTTQRDISGWGSFLLMGLIGVIIASVVNLFMQSSMLQFVVSVIGVLVFAGLTAWDTQRLKTEYMYGAMDGEVMEKSAISGALSLYLNFINMFTMLLSLFGQRE